MNKKLKLILTGLGLSIVAVVVFAASKNDIYAEIMRSQKLINDVYKNLIINYVDDFDVKAFTNATIEDMLSELDPYTVFIQAEDRHDLDLLTTGKYGGVGIQIGKREDKLTVIAPMDDTPAKRAGIANGDVIVKIDSTFTSKVSLEAASDLIRGERGTKVKLTIERFGNEELLEFELIRADITVKDVAYAEMINDEVGYIRLTRFSKNSGPEMRTALNKFVDNKASAFILDLRNNPGGLLGSSIEILEMIVPKDQLLLTTKGRNKESNRSIYSKREPIIPKDMEIIVLINEGSASASEIVAGTLQDLDRAVIIGKQSYGKGLVQSVIGLDKDYALKRFGFIIYRFNTVARDGLWVGLLRPLIAADASDATTNRFLSFLTGGQAGFTGAIDNLDSGPVWEWLAVFFRSFWTVGIEGYRPLGGWGLLMAVVMCLVAAYGLVLVWRQNRRIPDSERLSAGATSHCPTARPPGPLSPPAACGCRFYLALAPVRGHLQPGRHGPRPPCPVSDSTGLGHPAGLGL